MTETPLYVGIDPGANGAISVLDYQGSPVVTIKLKDATPHDVWRQCTEAFALTSRPVFAVLEQVRSSPQMGVVSAFSFGSTYGMLRAFLVAGDVPFEEVTPSRWQAALRCKSGGDKSVTKARAQELFPMVKVTHGNADALLIAEYARKHGRGAGAMTIGEAGNATAK